MCRSEKKFRTTQEFEYLFCLSRKARIFFPDYNIRLYDKNSESDYYFFPPPKSEFFFQQHWESEYLKKKKTYPPFKLNGRFLKKLITSEKLDNVERSLNTMVNEVKADVNVLKVKCNTSITDIKELRRDFTGLERGVLAMDLQVQEIEKEKLEKQKTEFQKQIESLSEKVVLLEKHERKYNILIYGIDDKMRTYMP